MRDVAWLCGWQPSRILRPAPAAGLAALAALAMSWPATPALAQNGGLQPRMEVGQAREAMNFDIPAQRLSGALIAFGSQSGYQVSVAHGSLPDIRTPGIAGRMTPDEALRRLLAGAGITWQFADDRSVVLTRPATGAGVTMLDPVTVEGRQANETASGPVDGYVATRSAIGTKTDTPLLETPQAISVVTRDQMDARNVQSLNDTLRYSAGVQAGDTGDLTTESFSLRGFNSPFLSLHRDGTRQMFRGFDNVIEPYGLERVEILKGPASVLYGQGVPGGVVNVVTKRPSRDVLRDTELQVGTFDRYQAGFDLGGPASDDGTLQYRLTGMGRLSETQIDYVRDDRLYLAPALRWQSATHGTDLTLLASHQLDDTSFPDGLPASGTVLPNPNGTIPTSRFTGEPDWSKFTRSSSSLGYILDQELSETFSVHQTTRYMRSSYDRRQIQNRGLGVDLRTIDRRAREAEQESDRINIDTRLEARFGPDMFRHDVILGLDYHWAKFATVMNQGAINGLDLFTPVYGAGVSTPDPLFDDREQASQAGLYLQDQVKIADTFILVAGVRYDWASDRLEDRLGGTVSRQKDDAATYRLGAVYLAPLGLAPYASYTTSFQPVGGTDRQGRFFEPEAGEQYEIGVKFQPGGYNSFVTVSAFDLVRQNVQTPDPDDLDFSVQTGEVTVRGLEFEGVASLANDLNLILTYSILDAEITKSNDVDLGKRPTTVPERMASAWIDYSLKEAGLPELNAGAGVRYIADTPGDMQNTFFVPSYTVVDAALRYKLGRAQFAINATNLFDKEYVSACFSTDSCYYGHRRMVMGRLIYSW